MSNKKKSYLRKELNDLYTDALEGLDGKKIMGFSLKPALEPLEKIIGFVAKLVRELETQEERIEWLEAELNKKDANSHGVFDETS